MSHPITEGRMKVTFSSDWDVVKYDDTHIYREIMRVFGSDTKAVDIVARDSDGDLFLIELKDYRGQSRDRVKSGQLAKDFRDKCRHTIYGLVGAARMAGGSDEWSHFGRSIGDDRKRLFVFLWLEEDNLMNTWPEKKVLATRDMLQKKMKQELRWLTSHARLIAKDSYKNVLESVEYEEFPVV